MTDLARFFANLPPEADTSEAALDAALRAGAPDERVVALRAAAGIVAVAGALFGDLDANGEGTDVGAAVLDAAHDSVTGGLDLATFVRRVVATLGGRRPTYEDRECWNLGDDVRGKLSPWVGWASDKADDEEKARHGRRYWASHLVAFYVIRAVFAAHGRPETGWTPGKAARSAVGHAGIYWYWRLWEPGMTRNDPLWDAIAYRHFREGVAGRR